ncbi:hypothetical protein NQ317_016271 [Molorchus minor]|uniref:Uncharacterized protein n=1 Tax=Molorchus minor TaxID=1323400 RepID=A0ABQ9JZX6_9CUCU|nr:hypothetical protein NQ317_016271 [Molorchus minor]
MQSRIINCFRKRVFNFNNLANVASRCPSWLTSCSRSDELRYTFRYAHHSREIQWVEHYFDNMEPLANII